MMSRLDLAKYQPAPDDLTGAILTDGLRNLPLAIAPPPAPAPAAAPAPNQFYITNAPANAPPNAPAKAPANAPNNLTLQRYMAEREVEMTDAGDEHTGVVGGGTGGSGGGGGDEERRHFSVPAFSACWG
ncbi:hypothetical protein JMJ35_006175 [Cladonia borealis]|uniref:Uncharacterized protein n=1 Tax=Cladonia borealis TaxID=184061 RepID=A0AA39V132_9LECA|nr:hypothetical protein JMJ35_006175 [Cladonia borealis]